MHFAQGLHCSEAKCSPSMMWSGHCRVTLALAPLFSALPSLRSRLSARPLCIYLWAHSLGFWSKMLGHSQISLAEIAYMLLPPSKHQRFCPPLKIQYKATGEQLSYDSQVELTKTSELLISKDNWKLTKPCADAKLLWMLRYYKCKKLNKLPVR